MVSIYLKFLLTISDGAIYRDHTKLFYKDGNRIYKKDDIAMNYYEFQQEDQRGTPILSSFQESVNYYFVGNQLQNLDYSVIAEYGGGDSPGIPVWGTFQNSPVSPIWGTFQNIVKFEFSENIKDELFLTMLALGIIPWSA
jgi:hypothetical protein